MADASPTPSANGTAPAAKPKTHPRDSAREVFETIAFVVTLVLMLKLFVVEAFVIPTGSMAETLYGYQKVADCPQCGFRFPVNASDEADPSDGRIPDVVIGACCPNCRERFDWRRADAPPIRSGDRVLVHKALYHFGHPTRGDVVVFKFPVDPQIRHTAQNYIKRLWGLGGETMAINRGDLYRTRALGYPENEVDELGHPKYPRPADPVDLWEGPDVAQLNRTGGFENRPEDYTYHNAEAAVGLFDASRQKGFPAAAGADDAAGFELVRKTDEQLLAMRRIVYDNDHHSKWLVGKGVPPRWAAGDGWAGNDPAAPTAFTHAGGGDLGWVRYRHLAPKNREEWAMLADGWKPELLAPSVVTNFMGYNSGIGDRIGASRESTEFWVGDLILECEAEVGADDARVVLELSKGPARYQAVFAGGQVTLVRKGDGAAAGTELATRPTVITKPGKYALRFANVDCRLRVWVNDRRIDFGPDADVTPDPLPAKFEDDDAMQEGWTRANDVAAPAGIGAGGAVTTRAIKLWRDTYFTYSEPRPSVGDVAKWADTYYVQPGHYLCLGDNSAQSSDSRKWGTVPERLLLGKAVFVFFPLNRVGFIK